MFLYLQFLLFYVGIFFLFFFIVVLFFKFNSKFSLKKRNINILIKKVESEEKNINKTFEQQFLTELKNKEKDIKKFIKNVLYDFENKKSINFTPFSFMVFLNMFQGKILKSDDGEYFIIDEEDLKKTKMIFEQTDYYNQERLKKIFNEVEEKIIKSVLSEDKLEIEIDSLLYYIRNQSFKNLDLIKDKFLKVNFLTKEKNITLKIQKDFKLLQNKSYTNKNYNFKKEKERFSYIKGNDGKVFITDNKKKIQYILEKNQEENVKSNNTQSKDLYVNTLKTLENIYLELRESKKNNEDLYEKLINLIEQKAKNENVSQTEASNFVKELEKLKKNNENKNLNKQISYIEDFFNITLDEIENISNKLNEKSTNNQDNKKFGNEETNKSEEKITINDINKNYQDKSIKNEKKDNKLNNSDLKTSQVKDLFDGIESLINDFDKISKRGQTKELDKKNELKTINTKTNITANINKNKKYKNFDDNVLFD